LQPKKEALNHGECGQANFKLWSGVQRFQSFAFAGEELMLKPHFIGTFSDSHKIQNELDGLSMKAASPCTMQHHT
jgi:hypothetical protein